MSTSPVQASRARRFRIGLLLVLIAVAVVAALLAFPPVRQMLSLTRLYFANDGSEARWVGDADRVTLPFRHTTHVTVPVTVNDRAALSFALDTGAPFPAIVGGPFSDGLELELGRELPIGGSGSGPAARGRVARDLRFRLGAVELVGQSAAYLPWQQLGPLFASPEEVFLQGILGYDLFRRYVAELDFDRATLTLHRPESFVYDGDGAALELLFRQRKPYVIAEVTFDEDPPIPVKLHLDLGQNSGISLIPGSRAGIETPRDAIPVVGFGLAGRVDRKLSRLGSLILGTHVLERPICSFSIRGHATDGGRQGVLGLGMLSRFRVIIDYPGKRLILESTPQTHRPFEADMSGATFLFVEDGYVLKRVRSGSPAAEAGLREGDRLLSIDDEPADALALSELRRRLSAGDGQRVRIELVREGRPLRVDLVLRRRV